MPDEKAGIWSVLRMLGLSNWATVMLQQDVLELWGPRDLLGNQKAIVRVDGECTEIERLVVRWAERETVCLPVRPTRLVPPNVSSLYSYWDASEADIEVAYSAAALIRNHDFLPKFWISPSACNCLSFGDEANCAEYVVVDGVGEVTIQNPVRNGLEQFGRFFDCGGYSGVELPGSASSK